MDYYNTLQPGDNLIVRHGSKGHQFAVVVPRRGRNKGVRVWLAASKRWTKPRLLYLSEIVRLATAADAAEFKPDFGRAWERNI